MSQPLRETMRRRNRSRDLPAGFLEFCLGYIGNFGAFEMQTRPKLAQPGSEAAKRAGRQPPFRLTAPPSPTIMNGAQ